MDALVQDGICILNREKAYRRRVMTLLAMRSGDEATASSFALPLRLKTLRSSFKM